MPTRFDTANAEPTLIGRIRALLRADDQISFAELSRLEGFAGDYTIDLRDPRRTNIVLWAGVSADATAALEELIAAGEIHFQPTSHLTYLCDGALLKLPIVRQACRYAKPHWLPVVVKRGPAAAAAGKAKARRR